MTETLILAAAIFAISVLYSSVGHAGASGYLAVMGLLSVAPATMKPTALVLNLLVGSVATIRFARAGRFSFSTWWPFALASVPMAFVGGAVQLPARGFRILVGAVLLFAAVQLVRDRVQAQSRPGGPHRPPIPVAVAAGAGLGLLAGLTGTGGGIFLSPLLLFAGWSGTRESGGVTAAFVLVNSAAGLAGNIASVEALPPEILILVPVVLVGGLLGSELGARRVATATFRRLLAVVLLIAGFKLVLLP